MTPDRNGPDDSRVLSEDAVRRLLARASELEAARSSQLSIAELRDVAREAGISPSALEQALSELRSRSPHPDAGAGRPATRLRAKATVPAALLAAGALAAALLAWFLLRMLAP